MCKYTMKSLPLSERPREKLQKEGAQALSVAELLAIIIKTGNRDTSALGLANSLLSNSSNGIAGVMDMSIEEMKEIKGIGLAKAAQLTAAFELGRRALAFQAEKTKITHPSDVCNYFINRMSHLKKEHFNILMLDNKNYIIEDHNVSIGSLNSAIVHPREVFKHAIKRSSASIILVHNHPSGNTDPSKEDIAITKRLVECGNIIGIDVLDHIIIGKDDYFSLKEKSII